MKLLYSCLGITSNIFFDQFFVLADAVHRNKQKSNAQPTTLVLGKTKTKTTNLVFLSINQMLRNASSTRQLDSGEFDLRIWARFMATKTQTNCTTWSFWSYRKDAIQWETCSHVRQIYRVINSFNDAHTASRFYKNGPSLKKISPLISLQSVLNLPASVNSPFCQGKPQIREQLHDADDA